METLNPSPDNRSICRRRASISSAMPLRSRHRTPPRKEACFSDDPQTCRSYSPSVEGAIGQSEEILRLSRAPTVSMTCIGLRQHRRVTTAQSCSRIAFQGPASNVAPGIARRERPRPHRAVVDARLALHP